MSIIAHLKKPLIIYRMDKKFMAFIHSLMLKL